MCDEWHSGDSKRNPVCTWEENTDWNRISIVLRRPISVRLRIDQRKRFERPQLGRRRYESYYWRWMEKFFHRIYERKSFDAMLDRIQDVWVYGGAMAVGGIDRISGTGPINRLSFSPCFFLLSISSVATLLPGERWLFCGFVISRFRYFATSVFAYCRWCSEVCTSMNASSMGIGI